MDIQSSSIEKMMRDAVSSLSPEAKARVKPVILRMGEGLLEMSEALLKELDPSHALVPLLMAVGSFIEGGAIEDLINATDDVVLSASELDG